MDEMCYLDHLCEEFLKLMQDTPYVLRGTHQKRLQGVLSIAFPGYEVEALLLQLALMRIAVLLHRQREKDADDLEAVEEAGNQRGSAPEDGDSGAKPIRMGKHAILLLKNSSKLDSKPFHYKRKARTDRIL